MAPAGDRVLEEARTSYQAGDFNRAHEAALAGLAERPDDPVLLRLAGVAGLEIEDAGALGYLQKATAVAPDDADAWCELGDALASAGRMDDAGDAFRRAAELRPDDTRPLIDLGHTALEAGRDDEAVSHLEQALDREPGNPEALRALVEIHRRSDRLEEALAAAQKLCQGQPDDPLAALDVVDLALALDRLDDAKAALNHVRSCDDDPEHVVYSFHGLIEVEMRAGRWRRALDLAVDATRVDRLGRTTDILAFIVAQVFGENDDRAAPELKEVDRALAASRTEHRRLHEEALVLL
jgi:tetratricopeptide (TPR) repeat protein